MEKRLPQEMKPLFQRHRETRMDLSAQERFEQFAAGFRLGGRLVSEIYHV